MDYFKLIESQNGRLHFQYGRGLSSHNSTTMLRVKGNQDRLAYFQAIEVILNSNLAAKNKRNSINHILRKYVEMNDFFTARAVQEFVERTVIAPTTAITGTMLLRWFFFTCVFGSLIYGVWNIDTPNQDVYEALVAVGYSLMIAYVVVGVRAWEYLCEEQGYLGRYYYSLASVKHYLAKWLDGYRF